MITSKELLHEAKMIHKSGLVSRLNERDRKFGQIRVPAYVDSFPQSQYEIRETSSRVI
ncbi:hypothetical protein HN747_02740 [archaeon]|jgi:hypothetical protein|nr:hypothetical protein [archaeon]